MHDVKVKLKNGRILNGPLWVWRPLEGYFTLGGEEDPDERIYFTEVESAINSGNRTSVTEVNVDEDLLARAKKNGWKPNE